MIEKEIYSPPTKEDEAIMTMAKNQIEIDEYLLAKEFEEALNEAREKGFKGTDREFAEDYYRDQYKDGGSTNKTFEPNSAKELFDRINKTLIFKRIIIHIIKILPIFNKDNLNIYGGDLVY